jgi:type II secretory pathway component GspD/PulD (secretin)
MRRVYLLFFNFLGFAGLLLASDTFEKMEVQVYPLDLSDFEVAQQVVAGMISPDAKLVPDKTNNRLIIYDYPSVHQAVRQALRKVRAPLQNVRIQVSFRNNSTASNQDVGVTGVIRSGNATVMTGGAQEHSTHVQINNMNSSLASIVQQELLVMSGGKARLRVGTDLPYLDWFWTYGTQNGLWGIAVGGGTVRWKEVGASMIVEPYVMAGGKIRVRLTPEFSYVLEGQTLSTAVEKLTTEIFVQDGQEIDLGGISNSNQEFYSKFLIGYSHSGERRSLGITLKPKIETLAVP